MLHTDAIPQDELPSPIIFRPLTQDDILEIASWRYPGQYAAYNIDGQQMVQDNADPRNRFFALLRGDELSGFCVYGPDGQIPAGIYSEDALDIGIGLRPNLTGRGSGKEFTSAIVAHARQELEADTLRVTIAAWNARSIRAWQAAGFVETSRFGAEHGGAEYAVLTLRA